MREEEASAIRAQCHPVVQFSRIILFPKAFVQCETVQSGPLSRRRTVDGVKHDAYPEPAGVIAISLIEAEQLGIEW